MTQSWPGLRAQAGDTLARLDDHRPEVMTLEDMEFCLVPGGPFWMGAAENDDLASDDEKPLHLNKSLTRDYWIARYPVTQAQFRLFVAAGGYTQAAYWSEAKSWEKTGFKGKYDTQCRQEPGFFGVPFNLPNHPVVGVTWYEALAFCRWLTQSFQEKNSRVGEFRLPSEAEWEKAARGGEQILLTPVLRKVSEIQPGVSFDQTENTRPRRPYPWGEEINPNFSNFKETGISATSAVGCFPASASSCGCEELSGNVWEWCQTQWRKNYRTDADESLEGTDARVLRGGAYVNNLQLVRCASRGGYSPNYRNLNVGFRVVFLPYR
jgi:formylglycine-generating enzyme required for sulfatase activity